MQKNDFALKVGGEAGMGIKVMGIMFAKVCMRSGLNVFGYLEYPSLIRGGHNTYHITVKEREVNSQYEHVDLLLALNKDTIDQDAKYLSADGAILYDGESFKLNSKEVPKGVQLYSVPLKRFAQEAGTAKMMNTVAVGAILALLDYDITILKELLKEVFSDKGDKIVQGNFKAAKAGYEYAKKNFASKFNFQLKPKKSSKKIFLTGNEAVVVGAVKAGVKFHAAYPMTPATSIMQGIAALEEEYNIVVKHTEDEIAAINMIQGAAMTGARSMTCTSTGGFALMVEGFGMAGTAEQPIVAVVSQRGVPGTGLPTWTDQGDLKFMANAGPGETPRIIIAPGDVDECYTETFNAFNLAERYQMPVVILLDKFISESNKSTAPFSDKGQKIDRGKLLSDEELSKIKDYKRYEFTKDGVSPRAVPGQEGSVHVVSSYEHDEYGGTSEDEANSEQMNDKRWKKLEVAMKDIPGPVLYGPKEADLTLVSWGSNKGPILEALEILKEKGKKVNYLHFAYVWPLPKEEVKKALEDTNKTLLLEVNKFAQFGGIINEYTDIKLKNTFLKYGGRQFWPEEIVERVNKELK